MLTKVLSPKIDEPPEPGQLLHESESPRTDARGTVSGWLARGICLRSSAATVTGSSAARARGRSRSG